MQSKSEGKSAHNEKRSRDGMDLSQIITIDRHVGWTSSLKGARPKGDGMVLSSFLCDGVLSFHIEVCYGSN